jgi:hypothetical protein
MTEETRKMHGILADCFWERLNFEMVTTLQIIGE